MQGVGFRPFVYRLAVREGLGGFVLNDSRGVTIEVEGASEALERFERALAEELPPLASILTLERAELEPEGRDGFEITGSRTLDGRSALVTADSATCGECLAELLDKSDRRYRYPFINCTNCGPRYTIIEGIPYDRPATTMRSFTMCAECQQEYDDPLSRRFHAQPNACPVCGPRLWAVDARGAEIETRDAVEYADEALREGLVVALKGLGGFHLAVDATSEAAVQRLRLRKRRDEKAFAMMVRDVAAAGRIVKITRAADRILSSHQRPIVLLEKKKRSAVAESVAPSSKCHGVMLPYTPLHHLLMEGISSALVMTSANISDEPIVKDNDEAMERLSGIADCFLFHDRDIRVRVEDSVVRVFRGRVYPVRRSRGWAPGPVILKKKTPVEVLAVGGELKNTIALAKGERVFISQHIGDLKNALAFDNFTESIDALMRLMEVRPSVVACDMHPLYLSARYARGLGLPTVEVQHHHAHIASVMAEHGRSKRVIGLACDGSGYGEDKAVWGCEVLEVGPAEYRRLGHLSYVRLPGGDAAAKEADRSAVAHLLAALGREGLMETDIFSQLPRERAALFSDMIEKQVNSPLTSSLGRLFDAAAAIAGVCRRATYEGQPAIEFEAAAARGVPDAYPWAVESHGDELIIDPAPLVRAVAEDAAAGVNAGIISARFHNGVAEFLAEAAGKAREMTGLGVVALSGGVFQNEYLLKRLAALLGRRRFRVLVHRETPTNDGCIALGQASVAAGRVRAGLVEVE